MRLTVVACLLWVKSRAFEVSMSTTPATKGLEGIVAANSGICYIDGDEGVLAYRGIDIHELAQNSNFEEVCYLLWFGTLPKREELEHFRQRLAESRKVDPGIKIGRASCRERGWM